MNLEIKRIYSTDIDQYPDDLYSFVVPIFVEIGEQGKEGAEVFQFVAASAKGLEAIADEGRYQFLRGYILLTEFDWRVIQNAVQNLVNHAQSRQSWEEVIRFFNRYSIYSSEDLEGKFIP